MNTKIAFGSRVVAPYALGIATMIFAVPEDKF